MQVHLETPPPSQRNVQGALRALPGPLLARLPKRPSAAQPAVPCQPTYPRPWLCSRAQNIHFSACTGCSHTARCALAGGDHSGCPSAGPPVTQCHLWACSWEKLEGWTDRQSCQTLPQHQPFKSQDLIYLHLEHFWVK